MPGEAAATALPERQRLIWRRDDATAQVAEPSRNRASPRRPRPGSIRPRDLRACRVLAEARHAPSIALIPDIGFRMSERRQWIADPDSGRGAIASFGARLGRWLSPTPQGCPLRGAGQVADMELVEGELEDRVRVTRILDALPEHVGRVMSLRDG